MEMGTLRNWNWSANKSKCLEFHLWLEFLGYRCDEVQQRNYRLDKRGTSGKIMTLNICLHPRSKVARLYMKWKKDYNDKVLHILSDKTFYRQVTHNLPTSILHEVQSLIGHLHIKGRIDDKTHTRLTQQPTHDSSIVQITKSKQT